MSIEIIPPQGIAATLPSLQARRTTSYPFTTVFTDITFNITDIENNPAVLEHNNVSTDRIDIKATGLYLITYTMPVETTAFGTFTARVRKNDSTIIPGSEMHMDEGNDTNDFGNVFIASLNAGDFISLQLATTGGTQTVEPDIIFTVATLSGVKGEKGDAGNPGGTTVEIQEDDVTVATNISIINVEDNLNTVNEGGGKVTIKAVTGGGGGGILNPSTESFLLDDFNHKYGVFNNYWNTTSSGGFVDMDDVYVDNRHPGIVRFVISASGNYSGISLAGFDTGLTLGGGETILETMVLIETLATALEDYHYSLGMGNQVSGSIKDHTNGVYFHYEQAVSPNWIIKTVSGGVGTSTVTSVAVAALTWTKLKFVVNATNTSVEFFIDGVSVGTISTNLPSTLLDQSYKVKKTVGSSQRTFHTDYHFHKITFTTPR